MGIFSGSSNRCLWCGLYSDETDLLPGFASWLCVSCAPKEAAKLEEALREFRPTTEAGKELVRKVSEEIEANLPDSGRPPLVTGGCANCGAIIGAAPLRISADTSVGWCVACLLAGLASSSRINSSMLKATANARRRELNRGRETEMTVRRAERRPFNERAYALAVKAANETRS